MALTSGWGQASMDSTNLINRQSNVMLLGCRYFRHLDTSIQTSLAVVSDLSFPSGDISHSEKSLNISMGNMGNPQVFFFPPPAQIGYRRLHPQLSWEDLEGN